MQAAKDLKAQGGPKISSNQAPTARPKEGLRISFNSVLTTPKCLHSPSHESRPTSCSGMNKDPRFAAEELRC